MGDGWLSGFERVPGNDSGTWAPDDEDAPKIVLHTTEGLAFEAALDAYRTNDSWPHLTVDPRGRRGWQHVPLGRPARALRNTSTPGQTNREGRVHQVEILGFAAQSHTWPDEVLDWLGTAVLRPLAEATGTPLTTGVTFFGEGAGWILASVSARQRLSAREWDTYTGVLGHQHVPENCVSMDTPVLGADLVWRPAGDHQVGDEVVGCEEQASAVGSTAGRRMMRSVVEVNRPFLCTDAVRVVTEEGEVVTTPDHPWLTRLPYANRGTRTHWTTSADLHPDRHELYFTATPWTADRSHVAGWLAGMLDADGHAQVSRSAGAWVGFGQVHGPVLDRFLVEMEARGFTLKQFDRTGATGRIGAQPFTDVRVLGGLWEQLRAIGTLRPHRLTLDAAWEGAVVGKTSRRVRILSIEPAGRTWMAGLQTSSRTFIGAGFHMHNSHWDPGALDIDRVLAAARGTAPSEEDTFMAALTPEEQRELLEKTRELHRVLVDPEGRLAGMRSDLTDLTREVVTPKGGDGRGWLRRTLEGLDQ